MEGDGGDGGVEDAPVAGDEGPAELEELVRPALDPQHVLEVGEVRGEADGVVDPAHHLHHRAPQLQEEGRPPI